jgi:hypothetical protein
MESWDGKRPRKGSKAFDEYSKDAADTIKALERYQEGA